MLFKTHQGFLKKSTAIELSRLLKKAVIYKESLMFRTPVVSCDETGLQLSFLEIS